jgi:hypothetical protein
MKRTGVTPASRSSSGQAHPASGEHVGADDEGDRISITEVTGTAARFDMSYSPPGAGARTKFGPPLRSRIPSALYLGSAVAFAIVTALAYQAPPSSRLFVWAVEGDRIRPLSVSVIAFVLVVSALATVIRTQMRGVIVDDDWVEARYLLPLGIPRARRWGWAQVTRIIVDESRVALETYDGSFERLPPVADGPRLVQVMMHHAARLRIDVTVLDRSAQPPPRRAAHR